MNDVYLKCLLTGVDLHFKRLALTNLTDVRKFPFRAKFQVDDEFGDTFIFTDPELAVKKFIELKKKMK